MKVKQEKRVGIFMAFCAIVAALVLIITLICNHIANMNGSIPESNKFGIGKNVTSIDSEVAELDTGSSTVNFTEYYPKDFTPLLEGMIQRREEMEARKRAEHEAHTARALANRNALASQYGMPEGLSEIDWNLEENEFVQLWGDRINVYLGGSALGGQGAVFAKAAWDNCIDPRWSPAISNTESSKGEICFLPHNAWGWGASSWDSWECAINDHVTGLAEHYGYTITVPFAQTYCPPNSEHWYSSTLDQMRSIG